MTDHLEGMATFVAVAEARGFRAAGERLGIPLVQRTTRSVRLTEAGERLYSALRPAFDELKAAVAAIGDMGSEPRGTIRLHVSIAAKTYLSGPLLAGFMAKHPHVNLDIVLGDDSLDIVSEEYDAGARLGEVIDGGMIAEPTSGNLRLLVVGAPSYFARRTKPTHPRDLAAHDCINWHATAETKPYRCEFTENNREFSVRRLPAREAGAETSTVMRRFSREPVRTDSARR